jgi:hypothetical protein
MRLRSAAAVVLTALAWPAAAQTVYRCADGYSQKPCPGGTPVQVDDDRSEKQRSDAGAFIRRDAKLADEMQAERLKQESQVPSAYIPPAKNPKLARRDAKPRGKAGKKDDTAAEVFTAGVPGSAPDKKKAHARKGQAGRLN